jgi:hypothetical protein
VLERLYSTGKALSSIPLTPQKKKVRHLWYMPIILVTQEVKIRRIAVQSQPRQIVWENLSQKYRTHNFVVSSV